MLKKIILLGSGKLGKELVIALKRLGQTIIIFGKPVTRVHRRMGVALAHDDLQKGSMEELRKRAKKIADCVEIVTG